MQREDYMLRMIAQMGRVLARIRRKLLDEQHVEAGEDLAYAAQHAGIDLRFVVALDEASLRPLLTTGGELDRPKCAFFAELVYLEWRRQLATGNRERAARYSIRALQLYAFAYDGIVMDDEARQRVAELEGDAELSALLNDAEISGPTGP
jgi:hypothetical protein